MSYVQLTSEERHVIYHLKLYRLGLREIGRGLGRSHATISREIKRNGLMVSSWVCWREGAQQKTMQRNAEEKPSLPKVRACATGTAC